jgi:hypothetical protein
MEHSRRGLFGLLAAAPLVPVFAKAPPSVTIANHKFVDFVISDADWPGAEAVAKRLVDHCVAHETERVTLG